jgi:aspartyl-tRNA(Asn)/glutamyl-tRNA(Gln) amidotransferase subunit C
MSEPGDFDIADIAELARVLQAQLRKVIHYIDKLKEVDTTGVELSDGPNALSNVVREDRPRDCFTADQALANAPRQAGKLFIVPRVIE